MRRVRGDTTFVGVSEFRTQADEIFKLAQREPVIVEKRHRAMAVLLPIEQYDRTQAMLDALEDHVLGLLAKDRERSRLRKGYLTLEEVERRLGVQ